MSKDRPPKRETSEDFLSVALGHNHLTNCHFGCLRETLLGLEDIIGVDHALFTVWSLKEKLPTGHKIHYSEEELSCFIRHERDDKEEVEAN